MNGQEKFQTETMILGMVSTNCYLLINRESKEVVVIDPADQADRIEQCIRQLGGSPCAILLTHGHFDHIGAARQVADLFQIPVYAPEKERELLADPYRNVSLPMGGRAVTLAADRWVKDGDELSLADTVIRVIQTPGHTIGGVCYYVPEAQILFSGDTLFRCSVGRTDLPTGSMASLHDSLHRKLFALPEDTEVCPGHGMRTDIRYEKRFNPY